MSNDSLPLELELFSELTAALYNGPHEAQPWQGFLSLLQKICHAELAVIGLSRPGPTSAGGIFIKGMSVTSEDRARYAAEFGALDPFVNLPDGKAVTIDEVIARDQLHQTEFYQRWLQPSGLEQVLGMDIYRDGALRVYLRALKGDTAARFGEEEKHLFNLLGPHLRQLVQWLSLDQRRDFEYALYESVTSRLAVGTVLLDSQLQILHCNPTAQHLLENKDGLRVIHGQIKADSRSINQRLQECLQQGSKWDDSAPPGLANTITVPRSRNLPPLYVVVKPAALKKSLFATDAPMELSGEVNVPKTAIYISTSSTLDESHQTMLQQLLGLSPRESHLAIGLANGMSLDEIADESGVKRSTVRSQLRSLFQKTGVNQQSALVSMVLRSLVGLG